MTQITTGIYPDERSLSRPFIFKYEDGGIKAYIKRAYCASDCEAVIYCDDTGITETVKCEYDGISGDYDGFAAVTVRASMSELADLL